MDRPRPMRAWRITGVPHASGDGPWLFSDCVICQACSPREWGWTARLVVGHRGASVFPTRVGMDRFEDNAITLRAGVPHASGDGPRLARYAVPLKGCSPREWGWTDEETRSERREVVFPTRVGMDRSSAPIFRASYSVPHASGDGPVGGYLVRFSGSCSPREWGWTGHDRRSKQNDLVFPTRVGMDRMATQIICDACGVPHASGDGPVKRLGLETQVRCSPREWGWTANGTGTAAVGDVFPTRVGMDRRGRLGALRPRCVPHASGDGPA